MELCAYNLEHWIRNNEGLYSIDGSVIQRSSYEHLNWASGLMDPLEDALLIMIQILYGLNYIHKCQLVHRDLNPRNGKVFQNYRISILVLFSSANRCWKIADFGFTTDGSSKRPLVTTFGRGTPCYRAPELPICRTWKL